MNRLRRLVVCAGSSLGVLMASMALAAPPAVLDRVPDSALAVVALPSAANFHKNISSLMTAVELPFPIPEVQDLLASQGIVGGVDVSKGVALVAFPPKVDAAKKAADAMDDAEDDDMDDDGEDEQMVMLVPVTSYEEFLKNFEAKPDAAGGLVKFLTPEGEDAFAKDIGNGYAAISDDEALLKSFDGKAGASPLKAKLGAAGDSIAESADVMVIVNGDVLRPLWPEIKKDMIEEMQEQAAALPMGGEANPFANEAVMWVLDSAMRDSKAMVGGLKTGNKGISLDLAVNFNTDSQFGKIFASSANSGELLSKLPGGAYLIAAAMDTSSTELRGFVKQFMAKMTAPGDEPMLSDKSIDSADGQSVVLGLPKGGLLGGGLMTGMVNYVKTKDAAGYTENMKQEMLAKGGKTINGMLHQTTYTENGAKVAGKDVDVWSLMLTPDDTNPGAAQGVAMMFGPTGGPAGYVAEVDGGVYMTFSKNSELLTQAMDAGKGGASLASDQMLSQVTSNLPSSRMGEVYIGVKGLMDMVLPFAAMAGVQIPAEKIPEALPPVAAALSARGGAAQMTLFVPAPVIKTAADIGMAVQDQMGDMDDFGAPPDGGKDGTGQPRF